MPSLSFPDHLQHPGVPTSGGRSPRAEVESPSPNRYCHKPADGAGVDHSETDSLPIDQQPTDSREHAACRRRYAGGGRRTHRLPPPASLRSATYHTERRAQRGTMEVARRGRTGLGEDRPSAEGRQSHPRFAGEDAVHPRRRIHRGLEAEARRRQEDVRQEDERPEPGGREAAGSFSATACGGACWTRPGPGRRSEPRGCCSRSKPSCRSDGRPSCRSAGRPWSATRPSRTKPPVRRRRRGC